MRLAAPLFIYCHSGNAARENGYKNTGIPTRMSRDLVSEARTFLQSYFIGGEVSRPLMSNVVNLVKNRATGKTTFCDDDFLTMRGRPYARMFKGLAEILCGKNPG
jgi:hypothetical protein